MKRLVIAVALIAVLALAAACGSNEEETPLIATAVPTYTVTAPGASQAAQEPAAQEPAAQEIEAEDGHAVESEAETPEEVVVLAEEHAVEETAAADASSEAETDEGPVQEVAEEAAEADQPDEEAAESETPAETEEAVEPEADGSGQTTDIAEDAATDDAEATETEADEVASEEMDMYAGLPEGVAALMPAADPARGEQLSLQNGCIGCHNLDPDLVMAGPTWHKLATTAETRVEDMTAAQYIHNSIVNPNGYVVEGFAENIMVPTYGETLSEQDQADLVAYLLGIRE